MSNNPTTKFLLLWLKLLSAFLCLFLVLRITLLFLNVELLDNATLFDYYQSFLMGTRFDLRMATYACLPTIFIPLLKHPLYMLAAKYWAILFAIIYFFFGLIEFEFYHEFQQRLNSLVFQYLSEDYKTVIAMLWTGMPILQYSLILSLGSISIWFGITWIYKPHLSLLIGETKVVHSTIASLALVFVLLMTSIALARGTFRSGPPLRWGDAYKSENMFLNHLALNGSYTLAMAFMKKVRHKDSNQWPSISVDEARSITRKMLSEPNSVYIEDGLSPIKRQSKIVNRQIVHPKNVVIILMESFSAHFVGVLGAKNQVTPEFDALSKEGILFSRFFSNGTHTHQGVFATLISFPNIPQHEYLMQQAEGRNQFSGITKLLPKFNSLFVYNGDFNWDNQYGFFRNQGLQRFVGRHDFIDPIYVGPVWGVSDEDMFNRGAEEIEKQTTPFLTVLQSLSNHLPYDLPPKLNFDPVVIEGEISERLTAMKYSDWALGQFFRKIKKLPLYKETLFVIVGDHGFAVKDQLTKVNLLRFHVPLLFLGAISAEKSGLIVDTVGSQVDIVPTIVKLLGKNPVHQTWGRDLFGLEKNDQGFAVIKPSGGEPTAAIIEGNKILTYDPDSPAELFTYRLGRNPKAIFLEDIILSLKLEKELKAYIQTANSSLKENTTSN